MLDELLKKYSDEGHERIGFVLSDGHVVELSNSHDDPEFGAKFSSSDLYRYMFSGEFNVQATWHTHPSLSKNLTGDDYIAFRNYPELDHYIIGKDGVQKYVVEDGVVKNG